MTLVSKAANHLVFIVTLSLLSGCGENTNEPTTQLVSAPVKEIKEIGAATIEIEAIENSQFNIGNTQYLFDVSDHSPEELEALLFRAEEIRDTHAEGFEHLEIALALHGSDIDIFRQENYSRHKPLVDLAAKLDAFEIIDMKICQRTMSDMGVERSEVPAFIETVPYAANELKGLTEDGYINL